MATSIKPADTMISIKGINRGFDATRRAIKSVKTSNGTVSVRKLEAKLNSSTNEAAREMPMFIRRNFRRKISGYTTNCSGHRERWEREEPAKVLKAAEVSNILSMLTDAKKAVPKLDVNGNKVIETNEANAAWDLEGLMGKMVSAAVHGARDAYDYALDQWQEAIFGVVEDIEMRMDVDSDIVRMAKHHCRYKSGREAIAWAFRDLATRGREHVIAESMDSVLMRAEDKKLSPFERMVMGEERDRNAFKKGHLNNTEVRHLLGVDDLEAFVAATKAKVAARVGDYENAYLKGDDIAGAADITDPDFLGDPPGRPTPHRDHC